MKRVFALAVLAFGPVYAGDYSAIRFKIPRSREPFGKITVQTTYAVKQKDGKVEYYFNPPQDQTCVHSIFPHLGYPPCWYLQRKASQQVNM